MSCLEVWKQLPRLPRYSVSNLGRVRNDKTNRLLSLNSRNSWGYVQVSLWDHINKKVITALVHWLVLEAFVGPKPLYEESRHLDDNKNNNCLTNLKYGTKKQNAIDKQIHGLMSKGATHGSARLNDKQVLEIRSSFWCNHSGRKNNVKELAKHYNVAVTTIHSIIHRHTWRHI